MMYIQLMKINLNDNECNDDSYQLNFIERNSKKRQKCWKLD